MMKTYGMTIERFTGILLLTSILSVCPPVWSQTDSIPPFDSTRVGLIYNTNWVGTAFAFGSNYIITCNHVVSDGNKTSWIFKPWVGPPIKGLKFETNWPNEDIAVFEAPVNLPGASFKLGGFQSVQRGDKVAFVGFDTRKTENRKRLEMGG